MISFITFVRHLQHDMRKCWTYTCLRFDIFRSSDIVLCKYKIDTILLYKTMFKFGKTSQDNEQCCLMCRNLLKLEIMTTKERWLLIYIGLKSKEWCSGVVFPNLQQFSLIKLSLLPFFFGQIYPGLLSRKVEDSTSSIMKWVSNSIFRVKL